MGFWNKLGKIALTAAPYIAAPFTGGASLLAAPMANKAVAKWGEHDAASNAAKGIAPSKFDKYLGMAGNIAGAVGSMGGMSKMGDSFGADSFTGGGDKGGISGMLGGMLGGGGEQKQQGGNLMNMFGSVLSNIGSNKSAPQQATQGAGIGPSQIPSTAPTVLRKPATAGILASMNRGRQMANPSLSY